MMKSPNFKPMQFWYFSTANQFVPDLPAGATLPQGPFREVRLRVDDKLAGVAFPYGELFYEVSGCLRQISDLLQLSISLVR